MAILTRWFLARGPNSDLVFIVVKLKEFQPRDLKQSPCHPATFKQMIRLEGWRNEEAGEACFCLDVIQRVTPCSKMWISPAELPTFSDSPLIWSVINKQECFLDDALFSTSLWISLFRAPRAEERYSVVITDTLWDPGCRNLGVMPPSFSPNLSSISHYILPSLLVIYLLNAYVYFLPPRMLPPQHRGCIAQTAVTSTLWDPWSCSCFSAAHALLSRQVEDFYRCPSDHGTLKPKILQELFRALRVKIQTLNVAQKTLHERPPDFSVSLTPLCFPFPVPVV